ncbi:MAG: 2-polyprenyl-6-methoxyphenol hydroxylase-like FAD-dependent oxidoreductase [Myxococcota bacterium]|jgi:2-polyprenyl-6-methoxyphenol hydroxylase-like FAD-dependent oxidoreductase
MSPPVAVAVVGAGLAGLAAATAAHRAGLSVAVLERAPLPASAWGAVALSPTAVAALNTLGLGPQLRHASCPIDRLRFFTPAGRPLGTISLTAAADAAGAPLILVERSTLLAALTAALPRTTIRHSVTLTDLSDHGERVRLSTSGAETLEASVVVGADGLRSIVRARLHGDAPPRPVPVSIWAGFAPLQPAALRREAHIVLGADAHAIALPAPRGRTWWLVGVPASSGTQEPRRLLSGWPSPFPQLLARTPGRQRRRAALHDRRPLARWGQGRVTLAGDAAHPCAPHLGQGASMSIDDAAVLGGALQAEGASAAALRRYESTRQAATAGIVAQSAWSARLCSSGPVGMGLVQALIGPSLAAAGPLLPALVRSALRGQRR